MYDMYWQEIPSHRRVFRLEIYRDLRKLFDTIHTFFPVDDDNFELWVGEIDLQPTDTPEIWGAERNGLTEVWLYLKDLPQTQDEQSKD